MSYQTKQKKIIIDEISKNNKEFTIKELYERLHGVVGLTTIYRLIDEMVKRQELNKVIADCNVAYYQYLKKCNEENHFYLKCFECKEMIHVDCDCIKELTNHISKKHYFIIDNNQIVMNGLCCKCLEKRNMNEKNN